MDVYHFGITRHNGTVNTSDDTEVSLWHASWRVRILLKDEEPGAVGSITRGNATVARWAKRKDGIALLPGSKDPFAGIPPHARLAVLRTLDEFEGEHDDLLPAIVRAVWTVAVQEGRQRASRAIALHRKGAPDGTGAAGSGLTPAK